MAEIRYDDVAPWPIAADGLGSSLTRVQPAQLGREALSWIAAAPTPGRVTGSSMPGDFNGDALVDASDIDRLTAAIRNQTPGYDLNGDGKIDDLDLDVMVVDILGTSYGDADLDLVFNSNDFVQVFQRGEYEDLVPLNSGWAEGDWDGDGDFTSSDFVQAFQMGRYEAPARPLAAMPLSSSRIGAALSLPTDAMHTRHAVSTSLPAGHHWTVAAAVERVLDVQQTPRGAGRRLLSSNSVDRFWRSHVHSRSITDEGELRLDAEVIDDIVMARRRH